MTETNSMMMPNQVVKIYRDGDKVASEEHTPKSGQMPHDTHTGMILDLKTHQSLSWDIQDPSIPCGKATLGGGTGDWSGDPFAWLTDMFGKDLSQLQPKTLGNETVAGLKAKVMELTVPGGGKAKIWVDEKYGLMVKMAAPNDKGQYETQLEVTQFALGKPPASVFVPPARCANAK